MHSQVPRVERNPRAAAKRARAWSDRTAKANANPQTVLMQSGKKLIVTEIGPPQFANDRDIWERQPNESDRHWAMFMLFRDQPQWDRTKKEVGRMMKLSPGNGTLRVIGQPATFNRWDERVAAYDIHCDTRMREELHQRRLTARIETAKIGRRMREKSAEALSALNAIVYVHTKDPVTGVVKKERRSAIKPSDIARLAEIGVKLERMALGEDDAAMPPGSIINMTQVNIQTTMSDEELLQSAAEIISSGPGDIIEVGDDGRADLDGAQLLHS